jgi:hypothetical protein
MDWTHLHLALNHIPVVGVPLMILLLAAGWWRRRNEVVRATLWTIALLSAAAIAIKFTGDFAAEESTQRLAPSQAFVIRHEVSADQATTGVFLLGLATVLALFMARGARPLRAWSLALVLLLGIVTAVLYARTANNGGQIGHAEIRSR